MWGVHTYLVFKNLTTQELCKKMYKNFPKSPYSYGRTCMNWKKVVCWPRITPTRLYYYLFLKSHDTEKFDKLRQEKGDGILPSEMVETSY